MWMCLNCWIKPTEVDKDYKKTQNVYLSSFFSLRGHTVVIFKSIFSRLLKINTNKMLLLFSSFFFSSFVVCSVSIHTHNFFSSSSSFIYLFLRKKIFFVTFQIGDCSIFFSFRTEVYQNHSTSEIYGRTSENDDLKATTE